MPGFEDEIVSIDVGKFSGMAVLDRNLLGIDVKNIDKTRALQTVWSGKIVYDRVRQGSEDVDARKMLDRM